MEKSVSERLIEIDIQIVALENIIKEKDEKWYANEKNNDKPFEAYWEYVKAEKNKIYKLDREKRFIMPFTLDEIPDYADVMPLKEFINNVNCGVFIDYDGFGHYIKDGKETNIEIYPSDVKHGSIRKEFDSVAWYNK